MCSVLQGKKFHKISFIYHVHYIYPFINFHYLLVHLTPFSGSFRIGSIDFFRNFIGTSIEINKVSKISKFATYTQFSLEIVVRDPDHWNILPIIKIEIQTKENLHRGESFKFILSCYLPENIIASVSYTH